MNIIILGQQGSGKGTQARILAEKFNLFYFESGDFSRELAEKDPRIRELINKGELIPEHEMTNYVSDYLEKQVASRDNILFDGYPRFVTQYQFLENWLKDRNSKIDLVFVLEISDAETIKRLSARRICEKCGAVYNLHTNFPSGGKCDCGGKLIQREDDYPQAIEERLREYKKNTGPMIEYIEKKGILRKVNGEQPIEQIAKAIEEIVKK